MSSLLRPGLYYPKLEVNLTLRFDEALFSGQQQPSLTTVKELCESGASVPKPAQDKPSILAGETDQNSILGRTPKAANIQLPGYRQAGTFSLTFDFRELPVDPRLVRACGVGIFTGTIEAQEFARAMTVQPSAGGTIQPASLTASRANFVLAGVVDNWTVEHNESGSTVIIDGRDLRGILLNSPIDPGCFEQVDLTKTIDEVVRQIISLHPFGELITVAINPDEWRDRGGIASPMTNTKATRELLGASGQDKGSSKPAGKSNSLNFWDIITRYCFLVGAVPYFERQELLIRPARSIFDQLKAGFDPAVPTPFANGELRSVNNGEQIFGVRKMVYGQNIKSLSFERAYSGAKGSVVQVVSYDTSSKQRGEDRRIVVQWPEKAAIPSPNTDKAKETDVAPSGEKSMSEVIQFTVPGIKDKESLTQIARDLYEEIGRQELGGSCQTKDLASFGGDNRDPDLLRLKPGDAAEFLVDGRELSIQQPLQSELTERERTALEEEVRHLRSRGFGETVARRIASSRKASQTPLLLLFRVANVKYDWGWDRGISISFDFQNYVVVRQSTIPSQGDNQASVKRRGA